MDAERFYFYVEVERSYDFVITYDLVQTQLLIGMGSLTSYSRQEEIDAYFDAVKARRIEDNFQIGVVFYDQK